MKTIKVPKSTHTIVRHMATLEDLAVLKGHTDYRRGDVIRVRRENDGTPKGLTYAVVSREVDPEDGSVILNVTPTLTVRIFSGAEATERESELALLDRAKKD